MTTTTVVKTALYYRRPGSKRWVLFDVFPTRDLAFAAVDRIPERHPAVWITPVSSADKLTKPTR